MTTTARFWKWQSRIVFAASHATARHKHTRLIIPLWHSFFLSFFLPFLCLFLFFPSLFMSVSLFPSLLVSVSLFPSLLRGALKWTFWKNLGFCPNWGGRGVCQSQFFFNQNHMVILLGFCHNRGGEGGSSVPTFFTQKKGTFSWKNNMLRIA